MADGDIHILIVNSGNSVLYCTEIQQPNIYSIFMLQYCKRKHYPERKAWIIWSTVNVAVLLMFAAALVEIIRIYPHGKSPIEDWVIKKLDNFWNTELFFHCWGKNLSLDWKEAELIWALQALFKTLSFMLNWWGWGKQREESFFYKLIREWWIWPLYSPITSPLLSTRFIHNKEGRQNLALVSMSWQLYRYFSLEPLTPF